MRCKGIDCTRGIRVLLDGHAIVLQGGDLAKVTDRRTLQEEVRKKIDPSAQVDLDYHRTPNGTVYVASEPQDWDAIDREEAERERRR